MNFIQATNVIDKADCKARRESAPHLTIEMDGGYIKSSCRIDICDYQADDWEPVEEKKTLGDRNVTALTAYNFDKNASVYYSGDVREHIKAFLDDCKIRYGLVAIQQKEMMRVAKDIFGKELVK